MVDGVFWRRFVMAFVIIDLLLLMIPVYYIRFLFPVLTIIMFAIVILSLHLLFGERLLLLFY